MAVHFKYGNVLCVHAFTVMLAFVEHLLTYLLRHSQSNDSECT